MPQYPSKLLLTCNLLERISIPQVWRQRLVADVKLLNPEIGCDLLPNFSPSTSPSPKDESCQTVAIIDPLFCQACVLCDQILIALLKLATAFSCFRKGVWVFLLQLLDSFFLEGIKFLLGASQKRPLEESCGLSNWYAELWALADRLFLELVEFIGGVLTHSIWNLVELIIEQEGLFQLPSLSWYTYGANLRKEMLPLQASELTEHPHLWNYMFFFRTDDAVIK